ncbi:MAG: hypothetical protein HC853_09485, partial [Anaerolineae bacterium]|nr:hypothetical protein [Anaerolineae bacterium]
MKRPIVLALLELPALLVRCGLPMSASQPQAKRPHIVVHFPATQLAPTIPVTTPQPIELTATAVATNTPIKPTDMPATIAPPTQMVVPNHFVDDEARPVGDVHDQLLNLHNQVRAEIGLSA